MQRALMGVFFSIVPLATAAIAVTFIMNGLANSVNQEEKCVINSTEDISSDFNTQITLIEYIVLGSFLVKIVCVVFIWAYIFRRWEMVQEEDGGDDEIEDGAEDQASDETVVRASIEVGGRARDQANDQAEDGIGD